MGRAAHFENHHFITAAQEIMALEGAAALTVQKIASRAGATTGSVYHRFDSLDIIAATAWVEAVEAFQQAFADSLQGADLFEAVLSGALLTPRWSRKNLTQTQVLLRFDLAELTESALPDPLQIRIRRLGKDLRATMVALLRRFGKKNDEPDMFRLLQFLLAGMPLAAVKPYLEKNQKPPPRVDLIIEKCLQGFKADLK